MYILMFTRKNRSSFSKLLHNIYLKIKKSTFQCKTIAVRFIAKTSWSSVYCIIANARK